MVERNNSCPCGSGMKYKKCCGKGQVADLQTMRGTDPRITERGMRQMVMQIPKLASLVR